MSWNLENLPFTDLEQLETRSVFKCCIEANRFLAELKGSARTIPNESILVDTLTLQEAKDSSEVENIITTQDDLFRAEVSKGSDEIKPAAKEVQDYAAALKSGFNQVRQSRLIRLSDVLDIQASLEPSKAGLRKLPGTVLKNQFGETVYEPPQHPDEIENLISNLLEFLNDETISDLDPLVKMAVLHHQFESIHPFYDGNGRTGRILNILYLVKEGLIDLPVLYLSRYIIRNKSEYYQKLQDVRDKGEWESWVLFMVKGVADTSKESIEMIQKIRDLMASVKHTLRNELPKIYSQDLLNNLFRHPYTKIDFIERDLGVSRPTATKYLNELVDKEILKKRKMGRTNYFINQPLFELLST